MRSFTDEQLSAYADGVASPETAAAIVRAMADDPWIRERLEHLRASDQLLGKMLDARLGEVPDRLRALASGDVAVAPIARRNGSRRRAQRLAIAASVALAIALGIALDRVLLEAPQDAVAIGSAGLSASGELGRAISTAFSGAPVATGAGRVSIELSFESNGGRLCRKFRVDHATHSDVGVACRDGTVWTIEGWSAGSGGGQRKRFETASGPSDASIDAVIDRLGLRNVLDRKGEARAINSGWNAGKR